MHSGNTSREPALVNVLKIYHVLRTHVNARPDLVSRFPNLHGSKKTRVARGASGPLEGSLDLAEYFVRLCLACRIRDIGSDRTFNYSRNLAWTRWTF